MHILDPGHRYLLSSLDNSTPFLLQFAKRVGKSYPGNLPPPYGGTQNQEVLRSLIDRTKYVEQQEHHWTNSINIFLLRICLWNLEWRAHRKRKQFWFRSLNRIEEIAFCQTCGHLDCSKIHETS